MVEPEALPDYGVTSIVIITHNQLECTRQCVDSIRERADEPYELIFVDTGSNDETPKIAERLGARVFHFPWCDSFSAARNESFRHARGEWIFWMDSDDTIDANNGPATRRLAPGADDPSLMAFTMKVYCQ